MFYPDELTGFAEHQAHELNAAYDDRVERYGDPCACGTLRWGGDCAVCMTDIDDILAHEHEANAANDIAQFLTPRRVWRDDDIAF